MHLNRIAPACCVAFASAAVSHAALVVSTANTPVAITFDNDIPGVFVAAVGVGTGQNGRIGEPGNWGMNPANGGRAGGFFSSAASVRYQWGTGTPYSFADDCNGDGDTADYLDFNDTVTVQRTAESGLPTRVMRLSRSGSNAYHDLYLRIQNNTGSTVTSWDLAADLFTSDTVTRVSTLSIGYAVDNGINAGTMSFTTIATRSGVNTGALYAYQSLAGLNDTITASVANGDYIVLAFQESAGQSASFAMDNLAITAVVPEPASFVLGGLALMGLALRRR